MAEAGFKASVIIQSIKKVYKDKAFSDGHVRKLIGRVKAGQDTSWKVKASQDTSRRPGNGLLASQEHQEGL